MPPAVAFLAAAAASNAAAAVGVSVAAQASVAAFAASAGTALGNLAIGVGLNLAASFLLRQKQQAAKPSNGQTEFQQPVPPRHWHYGRMKVAGPLAFFEDYESTGRVGKIILLSSREIDAVEVAYLDDKHVEFTDPDTPEFNVNNRYEDAGGTNKAGVHFHLGTDDQLADDHLVATWGSGVWSEDHRLRGIAYAVTIFADGEFTPSDEDDHHNKIYPNGIPSLKVKLRGAKLYDPRLDTTTGGSGSHLHADKTTWAWSENAALAVLDFLTHEDGYDLDIAEIDLAAFRDFADVCDEPVDLKSGGTEPRYRIATTVYMTEPRTNVLARLLEACDAQLYPNADGDIAIRGGTWAAPTVTITDDHILSFSHTGGPTAMERYNEIAFQYLSPAHGYTEVEGDPWTNAADILATGRTDTKSFDLPMVPSHGQARRLQKIRMARDNADHILELTTNFFGFNAIGERTITVQLSELEIDAAFWVEEIARLEDGTGIRMKLRSASETSYDWDADTEEGVAAAVIGGGWLIANDNFESDTAWDHDASWVIASNKATHTPGSTTGLSQNVTFIPGREYTLAYGLTGRTAGSVTPRFTGGTTMTGTTRSSNGTSITNFYFANTGNTALEFTPSSGFDGAISKVRLLLRD